MKKQFASLGSLAVLSLLPQLARAQYPQIPPDIQKASGDMMKEEQRQSDIAWNKAYPIIKQEAQQGKPYIPWAARPIDLPQSPLRSFPGAEGGGDCGKSIGLAAHG
ncbi:MAG: hypothetical protein EOO36_18240, partial [Cytophagaceae bacterium]